jgi:transcription elongation factor Elf1
MLKNMVENLVTSYKCPFCASTSISEKNIDIVWAAGNTVNIDMHCPSCNKHFMTKTEVVQMDTTNLTPEKLGQIQQSLSALKGKLGGNLDVSLELWDKIKEVNKIKDENILGLREEMKKKDFNASDLFSE